MTRLATAFPKDGLARTAAHAVLLVIILLLVGVTADAGTLLLGSVALVYGVFALSFYFLLKYTGLLSFGQAAFLGVGAYSTAIVLKQVHAPLMTAFIVAPLVSAVFALVIGWLCVRLKGLYFGMLTLAFSQLLWAVASQTHYFGGGDGLNGVPADLIAGTPDRFYWLAAGFLVIAFMVVLLIGRSPYGLVLRSVRDNEMRAEFAGLNVKWLLLSAFVLSAMLAGWAGALLAIYNRGVFPDMMYWTMSGEVVIMVLLGGSGYAWGAIVGAVALTFLKQYISDATDYYELALGITLVVVVLVMPTGLGGFAKTLTGGLRQRIGTSVVAAD